MKILFVGYHNPHFITVTEYIDRSVGRLGATLISFDDRSFVIPGRIREKISFLQHLDLTRINNNLIALVHRHRPDLCLITGGHRVFSETITKIKARGTKTILWTIDPPRDFDPVIKTAPYYNFVFTGGSEAYQILKNYNIKSLHFLPFACDPGVHKPPNLDKKERSLYETDIAFVGTIDPHLYPYRVKVLEAISDFNLSVWGPGRNSLPNDSPLKPLICGGETPSQVWTKIYSVSKIVICIHYKDPQDKIPCYQASPRVYEALACGAFLIVDAQKDVLTLFKNKEELVVFRDIAELRKILKYYLERPEARERIAQKGREKVLREHTYLNRIKTMLDIVGKNKK